MNKSDLGFALSSTAERKKKNEYSKTVFDWENQEKKRKSMTVIKIHPLEYPGSTPENTQGKEID